ncbi:hypothetical protein TUBRATIS_12970 [Tubulinosema ratisbonensis]|uniref:Uncharacterized protein n=1 Tax=Tubulinosema ratisbonensis TaxID=291195 RepID=A0A437ALZ1_9MICR|nr:hypothetical protein TUBRATIS_12970 [Tubulinosema ratisbonensis]
MLLYLIISVCTERKRKFSDFNSSMIPTKSLKFIDTDSEYDKEKIKIPEAKKIFYNEEEPFETQINLEDFNQCFNEGEVLAQNIVSDEDYKSLENELTFSDISFDLSFDNADKNFLEMVNKNQKSINEAMKEIIFFNPHFEEPSECIDDKEKQIKLQETTEANSAKIERENSYSSSTNEGQSNDSTNEKLCTTNQKTESIIPLIVDSINSELDSKKEEDKSTFTFNSDLNFFDVVESKVPGEIIILGDQMASTTWKIEDKKMKIKTKGKETEFSFATFEKKDLNILYMKKMNQLPLITEKVDILKNLSEKYHIYLSCILSMIYPKKKSEDVNNYRKAAMAKYFTDFINDDLLKSMNLNEKYKNKNFYKLPALFFICRSDDIITKEFNDYVKKYYDLAHSLIMNKLDTFLIALRASKHKNSNVLDQADTLYHLIGIFLNNEDHQILKTMFPELDAVIKIIFTAKRSIKLLRLTYILVNIIVIKFNYLRTAIKKEIDFNLHLHSDFHVESTILKCFIANVNIIMSIIYINSCKSELNSEILKSITLKGFIAFVSSKNMFELRSSLLLGLCFLDSSTFGHFNNCVFNKNITESRTFKTFYPQVMNLQESLLYSYYEGKFIAITNIRKDMSDQLINLGFDSGSISVLNGKIKEIRQYFNKNTFN